MEKYALQKQGLVMTAEDPSAAAGVRRAEHPDEPRQILDGDLASLKAKIIRRKEVEARRTRGVRGWLAVFILMVAAGSLASLLSGLVELREVQGLAGVLLFIPRAVLALYGADVFVLLLREKPTAPAHAARWLVANLSYALVAAVLVFAMTRSTAGFMALPPALALALWIAYLEKSKRVAATYRHRAAK